MTDTTAPAIRRVTTEPFLGAVTVTIGDAMVASTRRALLLREGTYAPVFYIPFADIDFDLLTPSATTTRCPYKGVASYWTASAAGEAVNDAMWAYQTPIASVGEIAGHGAFDKRHARVEATTEDGRNVSG